VSVLLIDNYDSFSHNLARYIREIGPKVEILRNDAGSLAEIEALAPSHIVISPGPCTPERAGISLEAVRYFAGRRPLLGVCLGHQCIAQALGGRVVRAGKVMHGKTSPVTHDGQALFAGIPLVVAASFSQTYLRNAYNNGFLCVEVPELAKRLREHFAKQIAANEKTIITGEGIEIDFTSGTITLRGEKFIFPPLGSVPQSLVIAGGVEILVAKRLRVA